MGLPGAWEYDITIYGCQDLKRFKILRRARGDTRYRVRPRSLNRHHGSVFLSSSYLSPRSWGPSVPVSLCHATPTLD